MADIFISYSRKDIAFARLLHDALAQTGTEIWIDWAKIPVGENWWQEISTAIEQSEIFLFIISQKSIGSDVCKREVEHALLRHKRIIPVLVDDTPEESIHEFVPELTSINWIIFRKDDVFILDSRPDATVQPGDQITALPKEPEFHQAVKKLNEAIHTDWEWVKAHTRLENRALEWSRKNKDASRLLRGKDLREAEALLAQVSGKTHPQPTELQRKYILSGKKAETRRRRVIFVVGLGILAIAVIAGFLVIKAQSKLMQEQARSESMRWASEAGNILAQPGGNVETAALLSIRALENGYIEQADTALIKSLSNLYAIRVFSGHQNSIVSIAYSMDGKYVLTGSFDTTAKLWDASTGAELRSFNGHTDPVLAVAFSPDGEYVLTGSSDLTAKLWNTDTGVEVRTFTGHTKAVMCVAFSPDGKYVLTGSDDDSAKLWDAGTGAELRTFRVQTGGVYAVAFTPDGKYVLISNYDTATLWEAHRETEYEKINFYADVLINSVAFSPDGKALLTGGGDNNATLWDVETGIVIRTFSGHADGVTSVAFSSDGKYVLTGSFDATAKLWDVSTGEELRSFNGHSSQVNDVAFSPDGRYVLTGSWDATARLWNASSETQDRIFTGHQSSVISVDFSPDSRYVLTGSEDQTAILWDAGTDSVIRILGDHYSSVRVAFSPDGKYILTVSANIAKLWDSSTGEELDTVIDLIGDIGDMDYSQDGRYLLTMGYIYDGGGIWDTSTWEKVHAFAWSTEIFAAFSPDGRYVLTGNRDSTAKLWDVETGVVIRTFSGHVDGVASIAFSPDGKHVLTGGYDNSSKLWNASTGAEELTFTGHVGPIYGVAFSPDGNYVLTGSNDNTVKLWDASTGVEIRTYVGHTGPVNAVIFSPDGKYILTGSEDRTARLWDTHYLDTIRWACDHLIRDLTPEERIQYGITDHAPTCP